MRLHDDLWLILAPGLAELTGPPERALADADRGASALLVAGDRADATCLPADVTAWFSVLP